MAGLSDPEISMSVYQGPSGRSNIEPVDLVQTSSPVGVGTMASTEGGLEQQHCSWGLNEACLSHTLSPKGTYSFLGFQNTLQHFSTQRGPAFPLQGARKLKREALNKLWEGGSF